jgi:transcriptional antiterminator NusG
MTPDRENPTMEPALNGDEPGVSTDTAPPEPNGSEQLTEQASAEERPSSEEHIQPAEEAPVEAAQEPEALSEPEAERTPEPAAQNSEASVIEAAAEPEPTPMVEPSVPVEPAPETDATPEAAPEAAPEPAPEADVAPGPVTVPETAEIAAEAVPAAEADEQDAAEAAGIADDISAAIAAAAATARASAEVAERAAAELDTTIVLPEAEVAVDGEAAEHEEAPAAQMFQPGDWFVVHTYAGYENKVKANLQSRISSMNMEEKIFEVTIPMEDVMEIKSGKKQVVQRKVFPGYLLVRMDLDDDSWYVVRNTPGVTGFVGSGTRPIPLSVREVDRILRRKAVGERPKPKLEWSISDPVRVTTGPFANFQGVISEIDTDRSKLKVLVNIFGRETPVELGFDQVAKV